jgi:hypothetical protein
MAATVEVSASLPAIVVRVETESDAFTALNNALSEIARVVAAQPAPVFLIIDLNSHHMRLDQMSLLMGKMARGTSSLLHHANLRETIVVTSSDVIRMALGIVNGPMFDNVRLSTFATFDEAENHCRATAI